MDFLLSENEISQRINKYFRLMEGFYGEEVAVETATIKNNILSSLEQFSTGFDFLDSSDIYVQLLAKLTLIDVKDNDVLHLVKEKIKNSEIEETIQAIESNIDLKRAVVRCYVRHLTPNQKLFESINDKASAKKALDNLYEYNTIKKESSQYKRIH